MRVLEVCDLGFPVIQVGTPTVNEDEWRIAPFVPLLLYDD